MFAFDDFALRDRHGFFVKGGNDSESAGEFALAKFAVADGDEGGFAINTVTNRATRAAATMGFNHG